MSRPKISATLRKSVYKKCHGKCYYCGCEMNRNTYQADHKIAYCKGGRTDIRNLVVSCACCNKIKADLSIEDFRTKLLQLAKRSRDISVTIKNKYCIDENAEKVSFYFERLVNDIPLCV